MAAKQLNKRLVVALSLFGFACMILICVLMLRQLQRRDPHYFVQLGQTAESQQQWQQAALFYNEAWERGRDARYLVNVGEMLLQEGDVAKALFAWRQALVHEPALLEAHARQVALLLQVAQLYATPARWQQALEAAEAFLGVIPAGAEAQQAVAHHAKGLALLNLESRDPRNAELGIGALTTAMRLADSEVDYALDLARELVRAERVEEGEGIYRRLVEEQVAPGAGASKARLAYAQFLAERQRTEEAEAFYQQSLEAGIGDAAALRDAKMGYSRFLMQRWARAVRDRVTKEQAGALFTRAEQIAKESLDAEPEEFEPYLQMALLYKAAGRHAEVLDLCEKRIRRGLSRKGVEATQNRISMFTLMIYASEACVALALQSSEPAEREQWLVKAEQYAADAKGESATHPRILSQAGRVKLARGQDREALKELRAADEAYGTYEAVNWENKIILAQLHLKLNEAGAAKEVLESVLEQAARYRGRDSLFWNLYAQVLFQNNELDRALSISDRVLLVEADNADARRLKAAIYERQGKHRQAGELHAKVTGSTTVQAMLEARSAALAGDVDGAVTILLAALERDPADVRLVATTINELIGLNRHEDAQAVSERALKEKPDDLRLQRLALLTRRDLTPQQRDDATLELIQGEEDALQRDFDLVMFHSRRENLPAALQAVNSAERHLLARDTPLALSASATQHAALLKAKMRLGAQLNDPAAMDAARDAAAKYNVDGAGGAALLGWYHLERKEFELALNAYRDAVAAQPTDATSMAHLGQCLQFIGRTEEARAAYEEAARINPNEGLAHRGLALLAQARGDQETFRRELAICERLLPNDPWVQEQTIIRAEEADPKAAIRRREARLAESPDDVRNLRRLAVLYENTGDQTKAESTYTRAIELRPDDEQVVQAAAGFFRRTNRPERALALVHDFAASRTDPKQKTRAPLLIANEHIQQRNLDHAERVLLAAYEAAPSMEVAHALAELYVRAVGAPERAVPWFQRAVEHARQAQPTSVPALLDAKIACLLNRSVNDLDQARVDVAELRSGHPQFVRGLLWESEIHARAGDIDQAVSKLSEYLEKRPNDAYALYQRARHHVSRGRTVAALADLEAIKRAAPKALDLQPRLTLARLHLRAGRRDLWLAELESLAKDAPDAPVAVEALAAAYVQEKRLADADRLVTAQINLGGQAPDARWYFLRGRVSAGVGETDRALEDYRRGAELSDYSPQSVAQVLDASLRAGRFAAGVEFFERFAAGRKPTAALVSRYAQLLARAGSKPRAVEEFRRAMDLALSERAGAPQAIANDVLAVFAAEEALTTFSANPPEGPLRRANDRILARAVGALGRTEDAAARYDALLHGAAADAERAGLLQEKGDTYQAAGRPDRAIESYQEALKYDSNNWLTLNNVAYLLSDTRGENEAALPFAQKAVALEGNHFTLDTLGWIYVGLGRYSPAIAELSRAVFVDPDYALSYYHLGEAYRRNSQFTEAADVLADAKDVALGLQDVALLNLVEQSLAKTTRREAAP